MANPQWIKEATVVDGLTRTGLYASDGSFNVVVSNPAVRCGIHHPCGAYWVTGTDVDAHKFYAPNGSIYVLNSTLA